LVGLKVDVIFAGGAAVGAVKRATGTIPIVFLAEGDPVGPASLPASLGPEGTSLD
jgi:ABC-type uncharacterized transport system substrate-binding protein